MAAKPVREGGSSLMTMLVAVLLLTLIGAGSGIAVGMLLREAPASSAPVAASAVSTAPPAPLHAAEDGVLVAMPAVLTNLAEPKTTWVRLEGVLLTNQKTDDSPDILANQASENVMSYLHSVKLSQIEGASGLLALREDLNDLVRTLSKGQVREVMIHTLVLE
ncbi:flagellar basal body-associated FliL family protein [Aestuariivirga sp.]|uniref:flagellar basal body-associated FliL family protein n=1 Tax=Aestuariivirga sp. TaxID=2650926 RepID=UPI0039E3B6D9